MSETKRVLFSQSALSILSQARFDPKADRWYDMFSGGYWWSDEGLGKVLEVHAHESRNDPSCPVLTAFRFVVAYRASLARVAPNAQYREPWEQLL